MAGSRRVFRATERVKSRDNPMRSVRILLVIVAVVCFGVALSYPVRYYLAQKSNNDNQCHTYHCRDNNGSIVIHPAWNFH